VLQSNVYVSLVASVVFTTLNVHAVILMTSASFIVRRESDAFELDTSRVSSEYVEGYVVICISYCRLQYGYVY
jgi:hypothetical protein